MPKRPDDLVAVLNVSGVDREIAATGQDVTAGGVVHVPADLAGRPPAGEPGADGYDPGEGLFAQPDNWRPATAATTAPGAGEEGTLR